MTLQKTPERRPKKIDINLLPSEYRPAKKSKLIFVLSITIAVLVVASAFLVIAKSGVNSDVKSLKTELTGLQQQLSTLQANKNEADSVRGQIADAQNQLLILETDYQSFLADRYALSQIITEIDDLVPGNKISLKSISISTNNELSITGLSTKRSNIYDFVLALEDSDFFTGVDFQFGDCPDISSCQFTITASLSTLQQAEGEGNE